MEVSSVEDYWVSSTNLGIRGKAKATTEKLCSIEKSLGFSKLRSLVWSQGIERKFVECLKNKVFVKEKKGNCN